MRAGAAGRHGPDVPVTADGATNVVLLVLSIVIALYLLVALMFPERF